MGAGRSSPQTVLRIGIVLGAGIVVGGAAPHSGSGGVAKPQTCHSRSDCAPLVMAGLQIMLIHHTWWTDFPSEPGDSGSPVLDKVGRAAGIVIATTPTQSV